MRPIALWCADVDDSPRSLASGLQVVAWLALVAGLLLALPLVAHAHGGGAPRLVAVEAGPYRMFAWTSPDPVRQGAMHVTVALTEPDGQTPVLDADVQVQVAPAVPAVEADALVAVATHQESVNKFYYETDLEMPAVGLWQATISVQGPAGSGSASFEIDVQPRSFTNWLLIGGGGLAVIVAGWLLWPGKRRTDH